MDQFPNYKLHEVANAEAIFLHLKISKKSNLGASGSLLADRSGENLHTADTREPEACITGRA